MTANKPKPSQPHVYRVENVVVMLYSPWTLVCAHENTQPGTRGSQQVEYVPPADIAKASRDKMHEHAQSLIGRKLRIVAEFVE